MKYIPDYSKFETLKNYALWYYLRYYPSIGKLVKKLEQKTQNKENIKKLLIELKDDFREEYLLEIKIGELLDKGKSQRFIISKLIQKDFKKDDIEKILLNLTPKSENNFKSYAYIKQKIELSLNKKSIKNIVCSLLQSGFDKEIISQIIEENKLGDTEDKILNEIEKLKQGQFQKEKIIQKMFSKGYKYGDFKDFL
ncbi:RecX family transcriptional regulator [Candidatus Gracilibacteria bacterium]|nr:RecX family transcriptional regulator [Candidatus Gracilibacteria bacterium]